LKKTICLLLIVSLLVAMAAVIGCGSSEKKPESVAEEKAEVKTEKVTVGDIEVAYRSHGEGYPLVMIMGYGGTMDLWDPDVLDALAEKYRVITFDNRGMGETTAGTMEFTMEQFADDTVGIMDALVINRAHVLGWSMGTNIATELALRNPDMVNKLILYAADPGGEQAIQPAPEVMGEMTDTSGTPRERNERLVKLLFPPDWLEKHGEELQAVLSGATETSEPENIARQTTAMESWPGSYDRLPQITSQSMLLTGTEDILTPPGNSLLMVQKVPGAWLVQLEGGGHGVMFQYPDEFSRTVLDFLSAP